MGKDAQDAAASRVRKEAELNAVNNGIAVMSENGNRRFFGLNPYSGLCLTVTVFRVRFTSGHEACITSCSLIPVIRKNSYHSCSSRLHDREREIPIPAKLVKSLKAWRTRADMNCGLVFPTAGCQPKLDFLDCLKDAAKRAKLEPESFWLYKFRATFATW